MYNIEFYQTAQGESEVLQFIDELLQKATTNKDSRIQYQQAIRYIQLLEKNGTNLPTTIVKHIEDEIYELRPGNNRIFFFGMHGNTFILLHHFRKRTRKTPKREILRAHAEIKDYCLRKELDNELE